MTDQPPPGSQPPPPAGGYPPPPPQGDAAYPPSPAAGAGVASPTAGQGLPTEAYTSWITRVIAWVLDSIPVWILTAIGVVSLVSMQKVETVCVTDESEFDLGEFCATGENGPSAAGWIIFAVAMLATLVYAVWNYGYRQGTTGSSIGKAITKFKVVSEKDGAPIGFGMSIVRQLAHTIDGLICYIGYLFPLWDAKRQTIADKLLKTVCLPL